MESTAKDQKVLKIKPNRDLVIDTVREFIKEWKDMLQQARDVEGVVIDLSDVHFIDSAGIGLVVGMRRETVVGRQLEFKVVGCRDQVRQTFESVKLDKFLNL